MNHEMMIELCCTIGRLVDERDMLRCRVDSLVKQANDDERARAGLADACTELADLRAKLALQQQIAAGAATQRDEQTKRLADAQDQIRRLTAERDGALATMERHWKELDQAARELHIALDMTPGATQIVRPLHVYVEEAIKRLRAPKASEQTARLADALRSANQYRDDYRRLVDERDALEAKLDAAQRLWESIRADKAERDALKASKTAAPTCERCGTQLDTWCERCDVGEADEPKASKPAVDVEAIEGLATEAFWRCDSCGPTPSIKAAVRAVLAHLGLTPATPHDGCVSTNELTKEEVAFARGDGVLVVSDDGLGSVPRDWYERAKKAQLQTGEQTTSKPVDAWALAFDLHQASCRFNDDPFAWDDLDRRAQHFWRAVASAALTHVGTPSANPPPKAAP